VQLNAQKTKLNGFKGNPKVSVTVLTELLGQVEQHIVALQSQKKKLAHMIADDEWLYKLREGMGLPGGTSRPSCTRSRRWQ
jgi:cell division protein ZapD